MRTRIRGSLVLPKTLLLAVLCAGTVGYFAPGALATNDQGHRLFSTNWTQGYHDLSDQFRSAGDFNINYDINPHPELNVNSVVVNQVGQINLFDQVYGTTWQGLWECVSYSSAGVCQQGNTYYNQRYTYTATSARSLVCEEVGHGVGLAHNFDSSTNAGSCMQRPVCTSCMHWNTHDDDLITAKY